MLYGLALVTLSEQVKHFRIDHADVRVEVQPDASLHVTEMLDYDFSGDFSGAYRDIPLAAGVRAGERRRSPRAARSTSPAATPCSARSTGPGTFGAEQLRLTEHGRWADRRLPRRLALQRRSTRSGRSSSTTTSPGVVEAYDDVVDVPWAVWGSQWEFWLDDLDAEIALAGSDDEPVETMAAAPQARRRPRAGAGVGHGRGRAAGGGRGDGDDGRCSRATRSSSVAGASAQPGDGLETVEAEEEKIDDEAGVGDGVAAFVGNNIVLLEIAVDGARRRDRDGAVPDRPGPAEPSGRVSVGAARGRSRRRSPTRSPRRARSTTGWSSRRCSTWSIAATTTARRARGEAIDLRAQHSREPARRSRS